MTSSTSEGAAATIAEGAMAAEGVDEDAKSAVADRGRAGAWAQTAEEEEEVSTSTLTDTSLESLVDRLRIRASYLMDALICEQISGVYPWVYKVS